MGGLAGLTDMFRAQATEKQRNALIVLLARREVQDLAKHGLTGKDVDGLLTPPFDLVEVVVTHPRTNERAIASYRLTGRGLHVARMLMEEEERPYSAGRQESEATPTDDGSTPDAPPLSPLKPAKVIVTIGEWLEKFPTFKAGIYGAWQHLDSVRPGFMQAWAASTHRRSRHKAHVSKSIEDVSPTMSKSSSVRIRYVVCAVKLQQCQPTALSTPFVRSERHEIRRGCLHLSTHQHHPARVESG